MSWPTHDYTYEVFFGGGRGIVGQSQAGPSLQELGVSWLARHNKYGAKSPIFRGVPPKNLFFISEMIDSPGPTRPIQRQISDGIIIFLFSTCNAYVMSQRNMVIGTGGKIGSVGVLRRRRRRVFLRRIWDSLDGFTSKGAVIQERGSEAKVGKDLPECLDLACSRGIVGCPSSSPMSGGFACPKNEPPRITTRRRCLQGQLPAKKKATATRKAKKIEQGAERHFGYPLFPPSLQREAKRARHARGNEIKKVETTKADEKGGKEEEERLAVVPKDPCG